MALHVRQVSRDTVEDDRSILAPDGMTETAYLGVKARSHAAHGWEVRWDGAHRFEAQKPRWDGVICRRIFWTD